MLGAKPSSGLNRSKSTLSVHHHGVRQYEWSPKSRPHGASPPSLALSWSQSGTTELTPPTRQAMCEERERRVIGEGGEAEERRDTGKGDSNHHVATCTGWRSRVCRRREAAPFAETPNHKSKPRALAYLTRATQNETRGGRDPTLNPPPSGLDPTPRGSHHRRLMQPDAPPAYRGSNQSHAAIPG